MLRALVKLFIILVGGILVTSLGVKFSETLTQRRYVGHSRDVFTL